MIVLNEVKLEIDETERRFGTSRFDLTVTVSDKTPFYERDWNPVDRYVFNAVLLGFGRDGKPSRSDAEFVGRFGRVVTERQLRCRYFPRFECRLEWVERVLGFHRFSHTETPSDSEITMSGRGHVTVNIERLDVAKQTYIDIGGERMYFDNAEEIFCRVEIFDVSDEEVVVATKDSNTIPGYFGANEARLVGTRDVQMEPSRPATVEY